ncbi:MAG: peptide-binding protein [Elusimicrobiota bacterium]
MTSKTIFRPRLLLCFLLFCFYPAAFTFAAEVPSFGDNYIEASIGDASYLNPILATDSASGDINGLIYNGLVKYDQNIILIGDLAESWKVSRDGLQIDFFLRPKVLWHDGQPFTAEDVKFTYEKLIDPAVKTPYGSDFLLVKEVLVVSPHHLRINYKQPFAPALESWGMGIIPKHIFQNKEINGNPANRQPIGTGPFRFKEWKTDEKIVLEANPDYFEGQPYISRYVYRIIPDQAVQFLELRQENIDSMGLTPDQYNAYPEFFKHYRKFRYPAFMYTYLGYNLEHPLFKEKKVRQALSYALNKEELIKGVLLGFGRSATGPFPPASWAYNQEIKDYPYQLETAKKLLAESGWVDSNQDGWLEKGGRKFEFTLMTNQGNKNRELTAEIIQSQFRKVGIKVNIRIIEWSTFVNNYIDKRQFDAVILGWSLGRDPDQYSIWHSSQKKAGQYNFAGYQNKEVDKLLETGRRTFEQNLRKKIYWRIHRILHEEQPYCFLYYPESLPVIHQRFRGPEAAPLGLGWNFIKWYAPESEQKYNYKISPE